MPPRAAATRASPPGRPALEAAAAGAAGVEGRGSVVGLGVVVLPASRAGGGGGGGGPRRWEAAPARAWPRAWRGQASRAGGGGRPAGPVDLGVCNARAKGGRPATARRGPCAEGGAG
jgi:hypothetical protein